MVANTTGAANVGVDGVTVGTAASGWGEFWFRGGQGGSWPNAGSIGAPTGRGALWDVTTLEGQAVLAGNWTPTIRHTFNLAGATGTGNITVRFYKYNGGVYTPLCSSVTSGVTLSSTTATLTLTAASMPLTLFGTGDKLYMDVWLQMTANSNAVTTATFRMNEASSTTQGNVTNEIVTVNGYVQNVYVPLNAAGGQGNTSNISSNSFFAISLALQIAGGQGNTNNATLTFGVQLQSAGGQGNAGNIAPYLSLISINSPVGGHGDANQIKVTRRLMIAGANVLKEQYVKVYDKNGNFLDLWRDAPLVGQSGFDAPKFAINTLNSQVMITLPRAFDSFDEGGDSIGRGTVAAGNTVQLWVVDNAGIPDGRLVYQGKIDGYAPEIDDDSSEKVVVTITPFDAALGDTTFFGTQNFGTPSAPTTYVDPVSMFNYPFKTTNSITSQPFTSPLTLDPTNPVQSGVTWQSQWHNESASAFFERVRIIAPSNWFWRANADKTVSFRQADTLARHTFIIGKHLAKPQFQKYYQNLKNDIIVIGTGCQARVTGADVNVYGQRTEVINEPRIIDSATCTHYAQAVLAQLDQVDYRSTITVVDIRGDASGAGYDIECIQVGDTCKLSDPGRAASASLWDASLWDSSSWDFPPTATINQVVTIAGLTYNFDTVDLELSSLQPSQDRFLIELAQRFEQSQFN